MIRNKTLYLFVVILISMLLLGCSRWQQVGLQRDVSHPFSIGQLVAKEGTLKNNIEVKGLPKTISKVQVGITIKGLNGNALSRYQKEFQEVADQKVTESYIEIELIDDIGFAQAINNDMLLKNYVVQNKKAAVISKIKGVIQDPLALEEGASAYLENLGGTYVVQLYNQEALIQTIQFKDLQIFDYQVSYFCFGKDERRQLAVMDIVEEGKRCKRPLERKAEKLMTHKKLIDY